MEKKITLHLKLKDLFGVQLSLKDEQNKPLLQSQLLRTFWQSWKHPLNVLYEKEMAAPMTITPLSHKLITLYVLWLLLFKTALFTVRWQCPVILSKDPRTTQSTCCHVKNLHVRLCKYVRGMFSELCQKALRSCDWPLLIHSLLTE